MEAVEALVVAVKVCFEAGLGSVGSRRDWIHFEGISAGIEPVD